DSRRRDLYWRIRRPVEVLLDEGLRAFIRKTRYKLRLKWRGQEFLIKAPPPEAPRDLEHQYQLWIEQHRMRPHDVAAMKAAATSFRHTPVVSLVTCIHDTDESRLRGLIECVRDQIYPHWELCVVNDGSTKPHVRALLDEYIAVESRMWVKHLPRQHGTAGASSHGLALATGDFVGFLGPDDALPPEALYEVVRRFNEDPHVELVYSDEDKLDADGQRIEPSFKPDWSPDLLLSMNYISNLSVFRRSVLQEIGGLRPGLDESWHYDLLLRFTERAQRV